ALQNKKPVFTFPRSVFDAMLRQAIDATPSMACGMLAGKGTEITNSYPTRNISPTKDTWGIHINDKLRICDVIRSAGKDFLAYYYSHHTATMGSRPSFNTVHWWHYDPYSDELCCV